MFFTHSGFSHAERKIFFFLITKICTLVLACFILHTKYLKAFLLRLKSEQAFKPYMFNVYSSVGNKNLIDGAIC